MSILARSIESSIKKGQEGMSTHIKKLTEQNDIIIDNLNDIMVNIKKLCDKVGIECVLEDTDGKEVENEKGN